MGTVHLFKGKISPKISISQIWKKKNTVNYKSFFLLPCPQSQNNTSRKLDPNHWSYLIFGEYVVLWLEKKKIGESFKVQFEEKSPNNGKNSQSFETAKLKKKKHCCKHIHNSFFFWGEFSHCAYKINWKFGDSHFSWCKFDKRSPQIEGKNRQKLRKFQRV